jgi:hypothetical protein
MLDLTKSVQTREGRKVRILCTDRRNEKTIVGLAESDGGSEVVLTWFPSGVYGVSPGHLDDLVNAPETHVVYLNMYGTNAGPTHATAVEAERAGHCRTACVRIEWKDGQFDE